MKQAGNKTLYPIIHYTLLCYDTVLAEICLYAYLCGKYLEGYIPFFFFKREKG